MAEVIPQGTAILGIDAGGTKLLARVVDGSGVVIAEERFPTGRDTTPDKLLDLVRRTVQSTRSTADIRAMGVGFPGLTDTVRGVVRSSVILNGWRNVPFAKMVSEATGLRCVLDNDVNNAARAEVAERGEDGRNMLFVSVGTGVGGAIVLNGNLWPGCSGLAGEIGHVVVDRAGPRCLCGRRGCAGPRAAGEEIARSVGRAPGPAIDGALQGDALTWQAIEKTAALLGRAIGNALNLLDLPLVVIGGGMTALGDRYIQLVARAVRCEVFQEMAANCRIETAFAGYGAGATGAALLACERLDLRLKIVRTRGASG
jgi:glucokinase